MLVEGGGFEIYRSSSNGTVLVVLPALYDKWINDSIFFNVKPFKKTQIEGTDYYYLHSEKSFLLGIVKYGNPLCNRHIATTFAFVLKQMRKVTDISLFDGIYIEEFGYVLPTYSDEKASDDAVLGTYLSGGQLRHFSDDKISALFLTENDYQEISKLIGIERVMDEIDNQEREKATREARFTITGRPELEKFFNEHIVAILDEPERYKKLGIDFPSSVVLYGPPGCGKTYAVDRLVEFLDIPKFEITSSTVASPFIHDTAKKISAVFEGAIKSAPSIVVIDEMESYLSNRDNAGHGTHHLEEVAEFLRQIQNAQENKVLIIAMTNMLDKIDPAILRRGRFDHHIEVGLPSKDEITSLLNAKFNKVSVSEDVDAEETAAKLVGKTLADVTFVMKEAALISGRNGLDRITRAAIEEAIQALPKEKEKRKIGFSNEEWNK